MYPVYTLLFLAITTDRMLARVIVSTCPDVCTCVGTAARCDLTDDTLSTVLRDLPSNLTKLDLSRNELTHLKEATFGRFTKLQYLSLAVQELQKGSLRGLERLTELHVQQNGEQSKIDSKVFYDTPVLLKVYLEGNPSITSLQFLRTVKTLREVLVDSQKGCTRCNYTRTSGKERCPTPGYCVDPRDSPFDSDDCACVLCSPKSRMVSSNCSQDHHALASRLMGDSNSLRVALWLISFLAFVSNLALIVSRCYTHTLRQKPLSIFIACIALSNLFVTTSVVILLASDMNQSPREGAGPLGQAHSWSQSVCGPVYFLKHFGIYSLVCLLTFIVMERFVDRGYHRCFTSHLTVRRSVTYVSVAWVLSFLFIIMPWTRITKWHRMCTASHEATVAQVMYAISGCLVICLCLFTVVLVVILFRRQTLAKKILAAPTVIRRDLGLILIVALTLLLIGVPHSIVVIGPFVGTTSPEIGAEIFTVLLMMVCVLYPILLARYYPTVTCLTDSFYSSSICSCDKCKLGGQYPTKCSMNSLRPPKSCITPTSCITPKSCITLSSLQESCTTKKNSTTITSTASIERMSQDSLAEIDDTWNSHTTKTKSWVEVSDYDESKRTRTQSRSEASNTFYEVHELASRGSDENRGNISAALVERTHGVQTKSWDETCNYDDLKIIRNHSSLQALQATNVFSEMDTKPCALTCSNENLGNCSEGSLEHARSSNTKSWVERCDYDDLKRIRNPSSFQSPKLDNGLLNTKPRALTWSDEQDGTLTSVADDVFQDASSLHAAIPELVTLAPVIPGESTLGNRVDLEYQKTSDCVKKSKRLSSFMELLQRTFSSKRQRSKSLPDNPEMHVNKVERSQSVPFGPLDKESVVTINGPSGVSVSVSPEGLGSSSGSPPAPVPEEQLASVFLIASPKSPRKNIFSPRKSKGSSSLSSPTNSCKSIADRIAKSFSLTRRTSPSNNEPMKTIALEEGDILTDLPVVRRNKLKTRPRDSTVRDSTASNGSTTTRFSLEWDPIGSMEGYADHEVLPPYPPLSLKNRDVPRFPQPPPGIQAPARYSSGTLSERYSSYSLDWDPTSVQPRNSMISRDSLSLPYPSDDEGSTYDVGTEEDTKGTTAWV